MRFILLFISLSTITIIVNAQFSAGLRQGNGTHGAYFEPPSLNLFQTPYYLPSSGLVIVYNNVKNAGLQLEINLANKGWKESSDTIPGAYFKRTIKYIEVPVLAHFEFGQKKLRPFLNIGPYIAWHLSDKSESVNWDNITEIYAAYNHYNLPIKKTNLGLMATVGLRLNFTKRIAAFAEVRYDIEIGGNSDIFANRPNKIQASRMTELSGAAGIMWHIFEQSKITTKDGYVPKQDLYQPDE